MFRMTRLWTVRAGKSLPKEIQRNVWIWKLNVKLLHKVCACVYVYIVCVYIYIYIYIYIYMCECVCVCVYIYK